MTVTLRNLTLEECEQIRIWRNAPDVLPMLRTKEPLTQEQQKAFFIDVVSNPQAPHRYYALVLMKDEFILEFRQIRSETFIGIGGMTYLDRRPGVGEISLVLGPAYRRQGLGTAAVRALLRQAFDVLHLRSVVGECYPTGNQPFWIKVGKRMVDEGLAREISAANDFAGLDATDTTFAALAAGQTVGGAVLFRYSSSGGTTGDSGQDLIAFYDLTDTPTADGTLLWSWSR